MRNEEEPKRIFFGRKKSEIDPDNVGILAKQKIGSESRGGCVIQSP